jgi:hypothetical protein
MISPVTTATLQKSEGLHSAKGSTFVHMPDGIRFLGNKVRGQQIWRHRGIMVRLRGDFEVAALFAVNAHLPP